MTQSVDTLTRRRYRIAAVLAVTFLIVQIFNLSVIPDWTGLSRSTVRLLEDVSLGFYVLTIGYGAWFLSTVRASPDHVRSAITDELVRRHKEQAMMFSFKAVFVLSFFMFVMTKLTAITARDVAIVISTACLVLPFLRFAWLESRDA